MKKQKILSNNFFPYAFEENFFPIFECVGKEKKKIRSSECYPKSRERAHRFSFFTITIWEKYYEEA